MGQSTILFPRLGIALQSVGRFIQIGSFEIAYYGIIIAIGMLLGIELILRFAKKSGQSEDFYMTLCLITLVCGMIGARLYYVLFTWDYYRNHLIEIFNIRGGGLAIYGGILVGMAVVSLFAVREKKPVGLLLDTVAPGLLVGQILGRWGNFFNREAFGGYANHLFCMALPKNAVYPQDITQEMLDHILIRDGVEFIQVHPTFLYESLWNLGLLTTICIFYKKKRFDGEVFLWYLTGYGAGRFLIESLRTDQLRIGGTGFPVSMLVSAILATVSILLIIIGCLRTKRNQ